jgi:hypothetical protein
MHEIHAGEGLFVSARAENSVPCFNTIGMLWLVGFIHVSNKALPEIYE